MALRLSGAPRQDVEDLEGAMVRYLGARSALPVGEADDNEDVVPARVWLAPADHHLLVEPGRLALAVDPPVRFARPSIDALFESAADAFGPAVTAVVLSGANDDGARGVREVKRRGGAAFAQDPATAERSEMPWSAIGTGVVDEVLPVEQIAARLNDLGGARWRRMPHNGGLGDRPGCG